MTIFTVSRQGLGRGRLARLSISLGLFAFLSQVQTPAWSAAGSGNTVYGDATVEEGKALYENEQYMAALSKFMTVLRRDPRNPEARRYLGLVVDVMRSSPGKGAAGRQGAGLTKAGQEELRQALRRRSLLTLDLKAIPGVKVNFYGGVAQVEVESDVLFPGGTGVLKEQAIPVLDRISAWLKSYGQQPIIIHCYPEELQDPSTNGGIFISRFSELSNFFVEERKIPSQRFISSDWLPSADGKNVPSQLPMAKNEDPFPTGQPVNISTTAAVVVIETLGSQSDLLDAMPSSTPRHALSRWLEFSVDPSRTIFNPEEGEWTSIDVVALSRTSLRTWAFTISPVGKTKDPVYLMEGDTNVLRRISWDGHHQKTGSFVPAGEYVLKLTATDDYGKIKTYEKKIQVARNTGDVATVSRLREKETPAKPKAAKKKPVVAKKPKPVPVPEAEPAPEVVALPTPTVEPPTPIKVEPTPPAADEGHETLIDPKPTSAATPEPASETSDGASSSRAIWKQVVQFDAGESDLKPTLKASLERIGKTLEVYPLQKVRIMGFAMTSEPDAAALAKKRAEKVRSILVDQYKVDKKRVIVAGGKTTGAPDASKVELSITN